MASTFFSLPHYEASTHQAGPWDPWYTDVTVDQLNQVGTRLAREKHYFYGSGVASLFRNSGDPVSTKVYPAWNEGREYQTEALDPGGDGKKVLRRAISTWRQRAPVLWWPGDADAAPTNDPRVVETLTVIEPETTNLVARQSAISPVDNSVGFDEFNNPTDLWEYDYGTTPGAAGPLVRHTRTSYVTDGGYTNADVNPALGASLRGLARLQLVYSVHVSEGQTSSIQETLVAKAEAFYDQAAYLAEPYGAVTGWEDPATAARGNATTTRQYIDLSATVAPGQPCPAGMCVETHTLYDQVGNVTGLQDANGNMAEVAYSSAYHYTYPTSVTSPAPDPTGQHGSASAFATFKTYDLSTGLVTSATDANGTATNFAYAGPLDRLSQVIYAVGTPGQHQTTFDYDDTNRKVTVTSDQVSSNDNRLKVMTLYDGLGRTTETRGYETATDYIRTTQVYDALGRVYLTSNPSRSQGAATDGWARTSFDVLGRVKEVATFAGATQPPATGTNADWTGSVTTTYEGSAVTVTDQAGRQRRSVSDALGRLLKVVEAPGLTEYAYETSYEYDVLGNLTKVIQGKVGQTRQTRLFNYDAISRLTSATNPESGTVSYEYDPNGNLKKRIDSRHVQTDYTYDALSRPTKRSYSMEVGHQAPAGYVGTPDVNYFYDGTGMPSENGTPSPTPLPTPENSAGRLTAVKSAASDTVYTQFDPAGHVKRHRQIMDPGTASEQAYLMEYGYDLTGNVTSEKYPSGRVVATEYDQAGRVAGVKNEASGNYYAGAAATDANNRMKYAPHGAASETKLGNGLWEHTIFNSRLQPVELGLGLSAVDSGKLRLTYGYGTAGLNNGNVRSQRIVVPGSLDLTQTYEYDQVNRLLSAREAPTAGGADVWKQAYTYADQAGQNAHFGNRRVDTSLDPATQLPRTTANVTPQYNPTINPSNNRFDDNQGYAYDAAGNLRQDPTHSYAYDAESKIVTVDGGWNGTSGANYSYDGNGNRVKKISGPTAAVYIYDVTGRVVAEYGGEPPQSGGTNYVTQDTLGSARVITGPDPSDVRARYDYLPFGEDLSIGRTSYSGETGLKRRFTGYERDEETKLDYARARYYAQAAGRFTSADPSLASVSLTNPQSWNRYVYCLNNPHLFVDPSGLVWLTNDYQNYHWVEDKDYKPENWEGYDKVDPGTVTYFGEGWGGLEEKYKDLVGGYVTLNADGTLSRAKDPTVEDEETQTEEDGEAPPLLGGLNPLYHPFSWRHPNIQDPWPKPPPTLRPMESPPIPEGFKEKIGFGPNGVQRGIEPDPGYHKNNFDSRWRAIMRSIFSLMTDYSERPPAPGPVVPIIITFPGWQCYASRGAACGGDAANGPA